MECLLTPISLSGSSERNCFCVFIAFSKVLEGAKRLKDGWARYSLFNRGHWNSAPATAVTRSKHAEARARPVSPYTTVLKEMDNIDRRRKEGQSTDDN